jgi:hypothetical protein
MIGNGFVSMASFRGHFLRDVDDDSFLKNTETFIQNSSATSSIAKELELEDDEERKSFELLEGQKGTIVGILEGIKFLLESEPNFPESPSSSSSLSSATTSPTLQEVSSNRQRRSIAITAENVCSEVQKTVRKRLKDIMKDDDDDCEILQTHTAAFPFSLQTKCLFCANKIKINVKKDSRYNSIMIVTTSYVAHVKKCYSQQQNN